MHDLGIDLGEYSKGLVRRYLRVLPISKALEVGSLMKPQLWQNAIRIHIPSKNRRFAKYFIARGRGLSPLLIINTSKRSPLKLEFH